MSELKKLQKFCWKKRKELELIHHFEVVVYMADNIKRDLNKVGKYSGKFFWFTFRLHKRLGIFRLNQSIGFSR
jgi:hypothetical protein